MSALVDSESQERTNTICVVEARICVVVFPTCEPGCVNLQTTQGHTSESRGRSPLVTLPANCSPGTNILTSGNALGWLVRRGARLLAW